MTNESDRIRNATTATVDLKEYIDDLSRWREDIIDPRARLRILHDLDALLEILNPRIVDGDEGPFELSPAVPYSVGSAKK